jgi:hypothetical protein
MKRIELYTCVTNQKDFLPFFLDYYSFVDKMTFIDSGSKDGTLELLKDHEVIQTGLKWFDIWALHNYKNTIWKGSKADLIFFPDLDEIFYKDNLREFLEDNNYDYYQFKGYDMVSKEYPKLGTNILDIKTGVLFPSMNKNMIFNPSIDISFLNAHHIITKSTNYCAGEVKCLHYRWLGVDAMLKRKRTLIANTLKGYMPFPSDESLISDYNKILREATVVI